MTEEKHSFTRDEVEEIKEKTGEKENWRALEKWAKHEYPIDSGIYKIGRVGKTFITILK